MVPPSAGLVVSRNDTSRQVWTEGKGIPQWSKCGVLFIGDDGMLLSNYGKHMLLPEEKFARTSNGPSRSFPKSRGHHAEWIHACQDRRADHLQL